MSLHKTELTDGDPCPSFMPVEVVEMGTDGVCAQTDRIDDYPRLQGFVQEEASKRTRTQFPACYDKRKVSKYMSKKKARPPAHEKSPIRIKTEILSGATPLASSTLKQGTVQTLFASGINQSAVPRHGQCSDASTEVGELKEYDDYTVDGEMPYNQYLEAEENDSPQFAEPEETMPWDWKGGYDASDASHFQTTMLGQLECSSMEGQILPGIQTAGHLGLSSHSGRDWEIEEMGKTETEEQCEDTDVLSLYEFDTFLEGEDDGGERRPGSVVSVRGMGESSLHLKPEENLSIFISNKCERKVSRPFSKEQNESESLTDVQKDFGEKEPVESKIYHTEMDHKPQTSESEPPRNDTTSEHQAADSEGVFQVPCLPASKTLRSLKRAAARQSIPSLLGNRPSMLQPPVWQAEVERSSQQQQSWDRPAGSRQTAGRGPLRNQQQHMEAKKELETELKHFLDAKNIFEATETVSRMHQQEWLKVDGSLVLNLLHLLIREGAVPQLMRVFSFVCNQGLFSAEVCNAYIRLGCAEGRHYNRQLKNIFQFLRRHSIQPAGDCIITLLRLYSNDEEDPLLFWLMLTYFDNFPGFTVPVPLVEGAILKLLQHRNRGAVTRFNQWVLTTRKQSILKKLDLSLIGRLTEILMPASLSRLQKIISEEESPNDNQRSDARSKVDTTLVMPSDFTDGDYLFHADHIQECGSSDNVEGLAQLFSELCGRGHNRLLVNDYAEALIRHKALVTAVDTFLHHLYNCLHRDETQGDALALAHVLSLLLEHSCFHLHSDTTCDLLQVIVKCPLVFPRLLMNCRDVGYKLMELFIQRQQLSQALDILKALQLGQNDDQGASLVKELMRQLVAVRDIAAACTALTTVASSQVMGIADLGVLSSQLLWHSLNIGNVEVALEILELWQSQPSPPAPPLPHGLLRAVLVACAQSGYGEQAQELFEQLKQDGLYNAEVMSTAPRVFYLSSMLTPAEIHLCLKDRLKELHHILCTMVASGQRLCALDRGLAVQILLEHNPQILALPFLALAPRSCEQAVAVVTYELNQLSPPLRTVVQDHSSLVTVEPVSLVTHLRSYTSPGLKQDLVWEDELEPTQLSSPQTQSLFQQPAHLYQSGAGASRQRFVPTAPLKPVPGRKAFPVSAISSTKLQDSVGRQSQRSLGSKNQRLQGSTCNPSPKTQGDKGMADLTQDLLPSAVDSLGRHSPGMQASYQNLSPRDHAGRPWSMVPDQHSFHSRPVARSLSKVDMSSASHSPSFQPAELMTMSDDYPTGSVPNLPFQPIDTGAQQGPFSAHSPSFKEPEAPCGREQFMKPRRQHSLTQQRRETKQLGTAPAASEDFLQSVDQHKPHRAALLPTPSIPPLSMQHFTSSSGESSDESPPKKMRAFSPQDGSYETDQRSAKEGYMPRQRQQRKERSSSSSAEKPSVFNSTQSPRGRGTAQTPTDFRSRGKRRGFFPRGKGWTRSVPFLNEPGHLLPQTSRRGRQRRTAQRFSRHRPQSFPGERRPIPLLSFGNGHTGHEPGHTEHIQSITEYTPTPSTGSQQSSQYMGHHQPRKERSAFGHNDREQFAKEDYFFQQSSQQRSWRWDGPKSRQPELFTGERKEIPDFPSRASEQMPAFIHTRPVADAVERQSLQGSYTRMYEPQLRVEPWGDAPPALFKEGEDLSWHSQQQVKAHPNPHAEFNFSEPFRQQHSHRKPVGHPDLIMSTGWGRGALSFNSTPNWRKPFGRQPTKSFSGSFPKN